MGSNIDENQVASHSDVDVEKGDSDAGKSDVDAEKAGVSVAVDDEAETEMPNWRKVCLIMLAVYLSMFLVALDRTIIGTAIPKITDDFDSIADVGWYASAYLLTSCAFQLMYGRIYTFYSSKWVLLAAIGIFEVGSAICGAAPSSKAFIVGRAIAGLGSAGIFSGSINTMVLTVPLHKRPMFQGIFGAVFGVASVLGPVIGGAFTTNVSWRWCFYINLPVGAVVVVILMFVFKAPPTKNSDTIRQQIMKLDPLGTSVFLPGIVCLLLALQWGGTTYAWNSSVVIALFILSGILLGAFIYLQFRLGDNATVPIRIIKQRSIAAGVYFSVLCPGSMMVIVYFLPLWFQAIKGVNAVQSGLDFIPLVMSLVVASITAGLITQKTGYYTGTLIACSFIMSIGAGLLTTLQVDTPTGRWVGYQILYGIGLGLGLQQASMAAQTCLAKKDVMIGISLMFFFQGIGGSVFISIGESILTHSLISQIGTVAQLNPAVIINTGATDLRNVVPPQYLGALLVAYNTALSNTLKVAVACSAATIVAGLTMEWKSVKGVKHGGPGGVAAKDMKVEDTKIQNTKAQDTKVENKEIKVDETKVEDKEIKVDEPKVQETIPEDISAT